jgi:hypothetical protein
MLHRAFMAAAIFAGLTFSAAANENSKSCAPGQQAKATGLPASTFAPGQQAKKTGQPAKSFAPGQQSSPCSVSPSRA